MEITCNRKNCFFLAGPSENYWEVIAERRRLALEDALEENKDLTERLAKMEEEYRLCQEMLHETRALVEVLQVCFEIKKKN